MLPIPLNRDGEKKTLGERSDEMNRVITFSWELGWRLCPMLANGNFLDFKP